MSKHLHTHYKFLATAATAALVVSATAPIASAEAIQFKDVSERYQEAVQFLVSTGAKGTSPSTFSTYDHIKRNPCRSPITYHFSRKLADLKRNLW